MTDPSARPPRFWAALVSWTLDDSDAEAILGDLEEEYREVVLPRRSRRSARRWYRRMALDSIRRRWGRGRPQRLRALSPGLPNPGHLMESLLQDLRFALRSLRHRKGFGAVVVGTLGLAVGANTTMFALVDGILLEPLTYPEPEELVTLWHADDQRPEMRGLVSLPNFDLWRERSRTVRAMASVRSSTLTVTGLGEPEVVPAALISDRFFEVFGAAPRLGRGIARNEARVGGADAVVLSYGYWTERFGADPEVLGARVELDGTVHTVVGVAPEGFGYPGDARMWVGERIDPERCGRGCVNFSVVGRTAEGVGVEAVREEFTSIAGSIAEDYGWEGFRVNVVPLREVVVGEVRGALFILLGAVGLVLLIACANIANLLLANARDRADEIAVRAALGAGRSRIVEQLLTESAVLAVLGGVLGLGLAVLGIRVLRTPGALDIPRLEGVAVDGSVLLFTFATVAAAVLLFGMAPAVGVARRPLASRMGRGSRSSPGRAGLVAVQVALSVVLLLGTALLLRTVVEVRSVPLGFEPDGVRVLSIHVPAGEVPELEEAIRLHQAFRERLSALPGVTSVGGAFGAPLSQIHLFSSVKVPGRSDAEPAGNIGVRTVTPGYLETLGIRLRRGRDLQPSDRLGNARVALINETAAREWFRDENPLGRTLDLSATAGLPESEPRTIVGVVGDTRFFGPRTPTPRETYIPHAQNGVRFVEYFVRTGANAAPLLPAARDIMAELNPRVPVQDEGRLVERVADVEAEARIWTALLSLFALLALGLASLGLFGVVAYQVAVRRREIGVRMAVGAAEGQVVALLMAQGLRPALLGLVVGLGLAFAGTRALESLLFGVEPTDPTAWLGGSALLLAVVVLASLLPSFRAARIDPARTLRTE